MADKIEFPLNNEIYFKQAEEFMLNGEYIKALEKIIKVDVDSPDVYYLHGLILYYLEKYEEALDLFNEYKHIYLQDEKYALSYVMLLIKNVQFIEAEAIILEQMNIEVGPFHAEWELLEMELNVARDQYNKEIEEKKTKLKYALVNMSYISPLEQTQIITEAKILDLFDLQSIAQDILLNYNVTPLNQRAFLELLIEKKDTQEYSFNWFQQTRRIIPDTLNRFEAEPIVSEVENILTKKLEKHPESIEALYIEIMNDLLMLYPFIGEVIYEPVYWVDLYLDYYHDLHNLNLQVTPANENQTMMQEWFLQMNRMSNRSEKRKQ